VADALQDVTETELDSRPSPEKWSAREIVHHLADSEMRGAIRLRQLLAEDAPAIAAYDEAEYARRLFYDRPIDSALVAFRAARETSAQILDRLNEAQWAREGTHPQHGAFSVTKWLSVYAVHAHNHADQIRRARAAAGSAARG
jgi:hypothetical protein